MKRAPRICVVLSGPVIGAMLLTGCGNKTPPASSNSPAALQQTLKQNAQLAAAAEAKAHVGQPAQAPSTGANGQ